jgi:hypothetical protein
MRVCADEVACLLPNIEARNLPYFGLLRLNKFRLICSVTEVVKPRLSSPGKSLGQQVGRAARLAGSRAPSRCLSRR